MKAMRAVVSGERVGFYENVALGNSPVTCHLTRVDPRPAAESGIQGKGLHQNVFRVLARKLGGAATWQILYNKLVI